MFKCIISKMKIQLAVLWLTFLILGAIALENCFEENTLFVQDSLPLPMSIEQCDQSCKAIDRCKVYHSD